MGGVWNVFEDQLVVQVIRKSFPDVQQRPSMCVPNLRQGFLEFFDFLLVRNLFQMVQPWSSVNSEVVPINERRGVW